MIYIIIGVIVIIIIIFIVAIYNSIVKLDIEVNESFSLMDIYLKKRWDLIPTLVEIVKSYSEYEKETLKEIVKIRDNDYDSLDISKKIDTNEKMAEKLNNLIVVVEGYPKLKSNKSYDELCTQILKIETDIEKSRRYYNGCVRKYNIKVKNFPSSIIAKVFGFKEQKMFEIKE